MYVKCSTPTSGDRGFLSSLYKNEILDLDIHVHSEREGTLQISALL
jgi:hypothetical protein